MAKTISAEAAERAGYRPLTTGYRDIEIGMRQNVESDLRRGGVDYVLVPRGKFEVEIWRRGYSDVREFQLAGRSK